ncbi:hypothetical protein J6590_020097 [Homalodisca vitripennis]|nr:hypothetical protein J6590_020097 [Homalodisca vitripennis]
MIFAVERWLQPLTAGGHNLFLAIRTGGRPTATTTDNIHCRSRLANLVMLVPLEPFGTGTDTSLRLCVVLCLVYLDLRWRGGRRH